MNETTVTEAEIIDTLISVAKSAGEVSPKAIVVARTANVNSISRTVKIAIVTSINNENVLNKLIDSSIENDRIFEFVGSETNLQGDLEIDYLFFDATVYAKIGA